MIYIPWFYYLERTVQNPTHIIHLAIDDYIPFIDVFIIPYMLWFGYISATVLWLLWKDKKEYLQLITFLIIGMTLFLVLSTLYPNGHQLRPASFDHNNIFTAMIARLYQTDSPNNILPSIHVYNSLGAWFAIQNSRLTRERPRLRMASLVMTADHPVHHVHQAAFGIGCGSGLRPGRHPLSGILYARMSGVL